MTNGERLKLFKDLPRTLITGMTNGETLKMFQVLTTHSHRWHDNNKNGETLKHFEDLQQTTRFHFWQQTFVAGMTKKTTAKL